MQCRRVKVLVYAVDILPLQKHAAGIDANTHDPNLHAVRWLAPVDAIA